MTGGTNVSPGKIEHCVSYLLNCLHSLCESLVVWLLSFQDLQDALLAFEHIRSLVVYVLEARCSMAVMSSVRSPR